MRNTPIHYISRLIHLNINMGRLKYLLICATIWKCIFIAVSAKIDENELKSYGLDPESLKQGEPGDILNGLDSDKRGKLVSFILRQMKKSFKCGMKQQAELSGASAFDCAISSARSLLENMLEGVPNDEMKKYSKAYSQTSIFSVNKTHDEWIHVNLIKIRKARPKKRKIKPSNFVHEIPLGFGRCLYLLEKNEQNYIELILESLDRYLDFINVQADVKWDIDYLKREFCGSISRTYHLACVIVHTILNEIRAVPQSTGNNPKKYFQDAVFEVLPSWYMRSQDITYLNIFRYSYSYHKNLRYVPIVPYFTINRWGEDKSDSVSKTLGPDSVVLPLLYNSTECGEVPSDKTVPPSTTPVTFDFDVFGKTCRTKSTTRIYEWDDN